MHPTTEAVFPLTLFQKTLTRGTRLRIKDARRCNADNHQRGSAEFGIVAQRTNNIGFGVNGITRPIITDTILSNGDESATHKSESDVIVRTVLRRVASALTKYIRVQMTIEP